MFAEEVDVHFKASNGTEIAEDAVGIYVRGKDSQSSNWFPVVNGLGAVALSEFFEMKADARLGRWRWPENCNYVVYPSDNGWLVLNELDGHTKHYTHRNHVGVGGSNMTKAARAYFDAHPEPKPWHDAKTGEVWVITVDGEESAWTVNNDVKFENPDSTYELKNPNITHARRIWPQGPYEAQYAFIAESSAAYPDVDPDEAQRLATEARLLKLDRDLL